MHAFDSDGTSRLVLDRFIDRTHAAFGNNANERIVSQSGDERWMGRHFIGAGLGRRCWCRGMAGCEPGTSRSWPGIALFDTVLRGVERLSRIAAGAINAFA